MVTQVFILIPIRVQSDFFFLNSRAADVNSFGEMVSRFLVVYEYHTVYWVKNAWNYIPLTYQFRFEWYKDTALLVTLVKYSYQ